MRDRLEEPSRAEDAAPKFQQPSLEDFGSFNETLAKAEPQAAYPGEPRGLLELKSIFGENSQSGSLQSGARLRELKAGSPEPGSASDQKVAAEPTQQKLSQGLNKLETSGLKPLSEKSFPGGGLKMEALRVSELQVEPRKAESDRLAFINAGKDGKIELTEDHFEKIGPKAAQVLKDAGVQKLTITPGKDSDRYEAELKKTLEIVQDPAKDGTRKLTIGKKFKADVSRNADGTLKLENIEGLTAESRIAFSWREASVDKIKLEQLPDGQSRITSTGTWKSFSRDNTRTKSGEIYEKANLLFGRMQDLKQSFSGSEELEIPP